MRIPIRPALAAVVVLLAAACGDPAFLTDEAACPGASCTDDTQDRLDAIAALDRVTEVVRVGRTYGLDSGSSKTAQVRASVTTGAEAREVAMSVLAELDDWPDHGGSAEATIVSDPPVPTDSVARETERLHPAFYDPCPAGDCGRAQSDLRERMTAELDGVSGLSVDVIGRRLVVRGEAPPELAALAARGAVGMIQDLGVRFAPVAVVEFGYRAPLSLTLQLDEGLVCEEPPGVVVSCEEDNSVSFER